MLRLDSATHPGQVSAQALREVQQRDSAAEAKLEAADAVFSAVTGQGIQALEKRIVTAPMDGIVWTCGVAGSWVQGGRASRNQPFPVVELAKYDLLRLKVQVPETVAHSFHLRQIVYVRANSGRETLPGMVVSIGGHADLNGKTTQAEIAVLNKNLGLTPGMYSDAELLFDRRGDILTVPAQAVMKDGNRREVFVLDDEDRLQLREVQTGLQGDALIQIVGGLQEGEQVVPDLIQTPPSEQLSFDGRKPLPAHGSPM